MLVFSEMATGTEDLVRVLFETNNAQNADEVEKALHKAVFITHPNLGQRLQRNKSVRHNKLGYLTIGNGMFYDGSKNISRI